LALQHVSFGTSAYGFVSTTIRTGAPSEGPGKHCVGSLDRSCNLSTWPIAVSACTIRFSNFSPAAIEQIPTPIEVSTNSEYVLPFGEVQRIDLVSRTGFSFPHFKAAAIWPPKKYDSASRYEIPTAMPLNWDSAAPMSHCSFPDNLRGWMSFSSWRFWFCSSVAFDRSSEFSLSFNCRKEFSARDAGNCTNSSPATPTTTNIPPKELNSFDHLKTFFLSASFSPSYPYSKISPTTTMNVQNNKARESSSIRCSSTACDNSDANVAISHYERTRKTCFVITAIALLLRIFRSPIFRLLATICNWSYLKVAGQFARIDLFRIVRPLHMACFDMVGSLHRQDCLCYWANGPTTSAQENRNAFAQSMATKAPRPIRPGPEFVYTMGVEARLIGGR